MGLCLSVSGYAQSKQPGSTSQPGAKKEQPITSQGQVNRLGGAEKGKAQQPPRGKLLQPPRGKGKAPQLPQVNVKRTRSEWAQMEKVLYSKSANVAAVSKLLDAGWDVNSRTQGGRTLLHLAMSNRNAKIRDSITKLLISRGADVHAQHNGKTADWSAGRKGYKNTAKLIRQAQAATGEVNRSARGGGSLPRLTANKRPENRSNRRPDARGAQKGGPHPDGRPPKVVYHLEKWFGGKADPNVGIPFDVAASLLKKLDNDKDGKLTRKELFHD